MSYEILPKMRRKLLWCMVFHPTRRVTGFYGLDEARQVLVWHQLWRRGQALVPMLPPVTVGAAIDAVLADMHPAEPRPLNIISH